ncbi:ribosomal RNA small subunit methyltransferase A [Candidatus Saccharibacteria bacterium]|nr:ribosomal RNA small subunit methyltransferase A [Candidatus Saccharibacteria bacterium]
MKNNKSLGQHWLKNRAILDQIAEYAIMPREYLDVINDQEKKYETGVGVVESASKSSDKQGCAVEIGPGLGTLTSSLLKRFNRVIAVEYDKNLANNLPKSFPGTNLEVVWADFLSFDLNQITEAYVAVGNIPYYITSPIIEKLLYAENTPKRIVLLIQKEVAERIISPRKSLLSLMVENRANAYAGAIVSRNEFIPPPKVDSKVIIMEPHAPLVREEVFGLIKVGFSSPRKKLLHNLVHLRPAKTLKEIFVELGISLGARPADLSLLDWERLYQRLK